MATTRPPQITNADHEQITLDAPTSAAPVVSAKVTASQAGEWLPVETLKAELIRTIAESESITIDVDNLNHLDGGALQVLLAAESQLKRNGKRLVLENVSAELNAWFGYAGASFFYAESAEECDE